MFVVTGYVNLLRAVKLNWIIYANNVIRSNHTTGRGNVNLVESRKTIGRCPINSSTDFQNGQLFLHYKLAAKSCHSLTLLTKVITIKKANFWYPFQLSIQHSSGLKGQEDKCEVPHWVPTGFWRIEVPQPFQGHDKPGTPQRDAIHGGVVFKHSNMVVWLDPTNDLNNICRAASIQGSTSPVCHSPLHSGVLLGHSLQLLILSKGPDPQRQVSFWWWKYF